MKKTLATGRQNIGDLQLAAIDIGYNLLDTDNAAIYYPDFLFDSAGFTDRNGDTWLIEGTEDEIIAELKRNGFEIEVPKDEQDFLNYGDRDYYREMN